jgi:hypothetical protein
MGFDGHPLNVSRLFDFGRTACVIVSGSGPNACGHALLSVGDDYFHVAGGNDYPRHMNANGYQRYLRENQKTELGRYFKHIPNRDAAQNKLMDLMSATWLWGVLPHNCIAFVEEVIQAGGATNFGIYSNCPAMQISKETWESDVNQIRRQLDVSDATMVYYFSRWMGGY